MSTIEKSYVNGDRGEYCEECGRFMPRGAVRITAYNGLFGSQHVYCSEGCAKKAGHVKKKGLF